MGIDYSSRPILVYTPYRVGAKAVTLSLHRNQDQPVRFAHHLRPDHVIERAARFIEAQGRELVNTPQEDKAAKPWELNISEVENITGRAFLVQHAPEGLNIVTLVRDPVAQILSTFFRSAWYSKPHLFEAISTEAGLVEFCNYAQKLLLSYKDLYPNWHRHDFEAVLGVNLLEQPFDNTCGYGVCQSGTLNILIMKMEHLESSYENAFADWMNIRGLQLVESQNRGANQPYGDFYERFKKRFRISNEVADTLYRAPYVEHFYNEDERLDLLNLWGYEGSRE